MACRSLSASTLTPCPGTQTLAAESRGGRAPGPGCTGGMPTPLSHPPSPGVGVWGRAPVQNASAVARPQCVALHSNQFLGASLEHRRHTGAGADPRALLSTGVRTGGAGHRLGVESSGTAAAAGRAPGTGASRGAATAVAESGLRRGSGGGCGGGGSVLVGRGAASSWGAKGRQRQQWRAAAQPQSAKRGGGGGSATIVASPDVAQLEDPSVAGGIVKSRRDYRPVSGALVGEALEFLQDANGVPPSGAGEYAVAGGGPNGQGAKGGVFSGQLGQGVMTDNGVLVVQFLLQLWISKKGIKTVLSKYPELTGANLAEITAKVEWFLDKGLSAGETGSAIVRDAKWLMAPMNRILDLAAYLERQGVAQDRLPRVLLKEPKLLSSEVTEEVEGLVESLSDLVSLESTASGASLAVDRLLERQPGLLQLHREEVSERVDVMAQYGLSPQNIARLVYIKPGILLLPPDVIDGRFANLQSIFSQRRLPNVFKTAPNLLCYSPEKITRQYDRLKQYLNPETAHRVVNAFPQSLSLNWERVLLPKFEYLEELGLERFEVVNFPAYLGYSLGDRIRPRCELLLKEGYTIQPHHKVISSTGTGTHGSGNGSSTSGGDRKFKTFGRSHREILAEHGEHAICIQHIVGLRDVLFEEQFGVKAVGRVSEPSRYARMRALERARGENDGEGEADDEELELEEDLDALEQEAFGDKGLL